MKDWLREERGSRSKWQEVGEAQLREGGGGGRRPGDVAAAKKGVCRKGKAGGPYLGLVPELHHNNEQPRWGAGAPHAVSHMTRARPRGAWGHGRQPLEPVVNRRSDVRCGGGVRRHVGRAKGDGRFMPRCAAGVPHGAAPCVPGSTFRRFSTPQRVSGAGRDAAPRPRLPAPFNGKMLAVGTGATLPTGPVGAHTAERRRRSAHTRWIVDGGGCGGRRAESGGTRKAAEGLRRRESATWRVSPQTKRGGGRALCGHSPRQTPSPDASTVCMCMRAPWHAAYV